MCHSGNVLTFHSKGVELYGGGSSRSADLGQVDVVLDLNDKWRTWQFPTWWKSKAQPLIVSMKIPDMGVPPVTAEFWRELWSDLQTEAASGHTKVLVTCFGGHGRTGLVLACLALAAGVVPKDVDPVIWLRTRYCDKAVESNAQLQYIEDTFGVKVDAPPAKSWMILTNKTSSAHKCDKHQTHTLCTWEGCVCPAVPDPLPSNKKGAVQPNTQPNILDDWTPWFNTCVARYGQDVDAWPAEAYVVEPNISHK